MFAAASSEPKSSSPKDESLRPVTKTPSPLTIPPPTPTVTLPLHSDEEEKKSLPVRLNSVKREDLKSPKKLEDENKDTELSKIKLKKAAKAVSLIYVNYSLVLDATIRLLLNN